MAPACRRVTLASEGGDSRADRAHQRRAPGVGGTTACGISDPAGRASTGGAPLRRARAPLKLSAVVWGVWMILSTTLWVAHEWDVNGAFERFGHEGDPGHGTPRCGRSGSASPRSSSGSWLWACTSCGRPPITVLRRQRLKFHVAAWLFGMVVLTPLWALIEWQDNGGFERWSSNGRPGDWDPLVDLIVGGVWALAIWRWSSASRVRAA